MKLKKRNGRKEIIVPEGLGTPERPRPTYQEALVIAIARGHRWMELLESGKFGTIVEMADRFGLCPSYMARLMRFTCLAPDIIEAILKGDEPSGFSLNGLTGKLPAVWEEQKLLLGMR